MEQYNKNNLNIQIKKTENKKMTSEEQKIIKSFFKSLNPKILNNSKTFYHVLNENSNSVNGLGFRVDILNRKRFYELVINFLSYIQELEPIEYDKENYTYIINKFIIDESN